MIMFVVKIPFISGISFVCWIFFSLHECNIDLTDGFNFSVSECDEFYTKKTIKIIQLYYMQLQAYLLKHGSLVQRSVRLLQQLFPLSGHLHCAMLYCGKKCSGGRKQHGRHVIVLPTDRPCRNVPGRQSTSENPRAERN